MGGGSGGAVYTHPINSGGYQMWYEYTVSAGVVNLVNVATGLYLDSNYAGQVYTGAGNNGDYQKWTYVGPQLKNIATGKVLGSNYNNQIYAMDDTGVSLLQWIQE